MPPVPPRAEPAGGRWQERVEATPLRLNWTLPLDDLKFGLNEAATNASTEHSRPEYLFRNRA